MGETSKTVGRNVVYNAISTITGRLAGIVITIFLARLLMPENFGVFTLALSVGYILGTITDAGINSTAVRYVSSSIGKKDAEEAAGYFQYLLKIKILLAAIVSISLFFSANFVADLVFGKPVLAQPLQIVALFVFVTAFFGFFSNTFYAAQQVKYSTISNIVYEISRAAIPTVLVLLGYAVLGALAGIVIAAALGTIAMLYFLIKKHKSFFGASKKIETKALWKFILFLTISSFSGTFFFYIDTAMLGALMPIEFVAYYRVAIAIVASITGVLAVSQVLLPVFTQMKDHIGLEGAFQKVFKFTMLFAMPASFGLAFVARPIIELAFGAAYQQAVMPLIILAFLIIEGTASALYFSLFAAKEQPQWTTYVLLVATVINVVLNYFLIIKMGMIGAAIAIIVSRYINLVAIGALAGIKLNVRPTLASVVKPLSTSALMLAVLFILPNPQSGLAWIAYAVLGLSIYIGIMWLIKGFNKEDIATVRNVLKN